MSVIKERLLQYQRAHHHRRHLQRRIRHEHHLFVQRHNPFQQSPSDRQCPHQQKMPRRSCRSRTLRTRQPDHLPRRRNARSRLLRLLIKLVVSVPDRRHFRILFQRLRNRRQLSPRPPIVPVQNRYDFPARLREPRVKRRRLPAIFLPHMFHARRKFFDDRRRLVRRPVIHHHNFQLRRRQPLLQHAHQRLLDVFLVVVRVHQRGNQWFLLFSAGPPPPPPASPASPAPSSTDSLHPAPISSYVS